MCILIYTDYRYFHRYSCFCRKLHRWAIYSRNDHCSNGKYSNSRSAVQNFYKIYFHLKCATSWILPIFICWRWHNKVL